MKDPMKPEDFRAQIGRLNLSRAALARLLNLGNRTVRGYAAGETPIPETVRLALLGLEVERGQ